MRQACGSTPAVEIGCPSRHCRRGGRDCRECGQSACVDMRRYSVSAEATARSTSGLLLPPCAVHTDEGAAAMGADKRTSHMPAAGAALGGRPWGRHATCVATRTPAGWRRDIRELSQSGAQQLSLSDPQCSGSMAQRAERRDSVREGRRLRLPLMRLVHASQPQISKLNDCAPQKRDTCQKLLVTFYMIVMMSKRLFLYIFIEIYIRT
jgi:hypothetical protein